MSTQSHQSKAPLVILNWILLLVLVTFPAQGMESRKLEEKCGACGYTSSPPPLPSPSPPIIYPSPPPPSLPPPILYPSPPPPSPKKPTSVYCPPPPSSPSYQYMTGPPGNLYPVDVNFSTGARSSYPKNFTAFLPLLIGFLSLLAF